MRSLPSHRTRNDVDFSSNNNALILSRGTAFVTGLTFTSAGTFNGTMTPITVFIDAVPEPETYALMLGGLALLVTVLRRSKRAASS